MSSGSVVEPGADDDAASIVGSSPSDRGPGRTTPDGSDPGARRRHGAFDGEGTVDDAVDDTDDAIDERPRMVRFSIGDRSFLVDVASVEEVLVAATCTRLPGAAPAIVGVTSVRGRIVAVIDPRPLLVPGTVPAPLHRIVVISTSDGAVGIVVDHVDQVVPAEPAPGSPDGDRLPAAVVIATAEIDGTVLPVIDPSALVHAALAAHDPTPDRSMDPGRT